MSLVSALPGRRICRISGESPARVPRSRASRRRRRAVARTRPPGAPGLPHAQPGERDLPGVHVLPPGQPVDQRSDDLLPGGRERHLVDEQQLPLSGAVVDERVPAPVQRRGHPVRPHVDVLPVAAVGEDDRGPPFPGLVGPEEPHWQWGVPVRDAVRHRWRVAQRAEFVPGGAPRLVEPLLVAGGVGAEDEEERLAVVLRRAQGPEARGPAVRFAARGRRHEPVAQPAERRDVRLGGQARLVDRVDGGEHLSDLGRTRAGRAEGEEPVEVVRRVIEERHRSGRQIRALRGTGGRRAPWRSEAATRRLHPVARTAPAPAVRRLRLAVPVAGLFVSCVTPADSKSTGAGARRAALWGSLHGCRPPHDRPSCEDRTSPDAPSSVPRHHHPSALHRGRRRCSGRWSRARRESCQRRPAGFRAGGGQSPGGRAVSAIPVRASSGRRTALRAVEAR